MSEKRVGAFTYVVLHDLSFGDIEGTNKVQCSTGASLFTLSSPSP